MAEGGPDNGNMAYEGPAINDNMGGQNTNTSAHASAHAAHANAIMDKRSKFSPFDGFTLVRTDYDIKARNKLFINPYIGLEYITYLNSVVGPIPGTEILKVNCGASSLFSLGLADTDEYAEETQQGQPNQKLTYNKYGRTYDEICYFIARKFKIQGTYTYSLSDYSFKKLKPNEDVRENFKNVLLPYLKKLLDEGSGTILQYGDVHTHAVAIIKHEGKLYMYDYQQQYIIPEEDIFDIIIKQSSPGNFYVDGQLKGGYSFITGEEQIKKISIIFAFTEGEQLYNKASKQSLGITNRMILYNDVLSGKAFKVFKNDVEGLPLYAKADLIMTSYGRLKLEDEYSRSSLNIHDLQRLIFFMIRNIEGNDEKNQAIEQLILSEIRVADKVIQDNFDLFRIWEIIVKHYHNEETKNASMATDASADFDTFLHIYLGYDTERFTHGASRKQRKQRKQKKSRKQKRSRKQKKSRKQKL